MKDNTAKLSKKGGQYGGTFQKGWTVRRNFPKKVDSTAELSKKGGQYGGTYDSHINMDTTAEPGAVPYDKPKVPLAYDKSTNASYINLQQ